MVYDVAQNQRNGDCEQARKITSVILKVLVHSFLYINCQATVSAKYNDLAKFCQQVGAALFGAALFFGCSNSSDTPFIPSSGGGSSGPALPASVGTNELAGKTFKQTTGSNSVIYSFDSGSYTYTTSTAYAAVNDTNSEYSIDNVTTYLYSYNATAKQLFSKPASLSSTQYIVRSGKKTVYPSIAQGSITSDAALIAKAKECAKIIYDQANDEVLTTKATDDFVKPYRQMLYWFSTATGYTSSAGADPATDEQYAKYNAYLAQQSAQSAQYASQLAEYNAFVYQISIMAYEVSGNTLKLKADTRVPEGLGLNQIFGVYSVSLTGVDGSSNAVQLTKANPLINNTPDYYLTSGNTGCKIASITADKVNVSKSASRTSSSATVWSFTDAAASYSYTTAKAGAVATFTIDTLGTINATYATASNVPDMTGAAEYTKQ